MITDLNKIIAEWSFRTKSGILDVKSMSHQIILEGLLKEYGWPLEARAELVNNLMESEGKTLVKNRDSGAVYFVKNVNDEKHDILKKNATEDDLEKSKKKKKKKELTPEEKAERAREAKKARKVKDDELLDSIEDPDEKGEIWTLSGKPPTWSMQKTKRTRRENAEEAIRLKENLIDAIVSGDEKKKKTAVEEMIKSGLFSTNAPGVDTKKLYIGTIESSGRKKAGLDSGKDTGRIDPATGLNYLKYGNNTSLAKQVHKIAEKHNLKFKYQGEKTGKKRMNPDNMFRLQDKDGKKAPTKKVKITKTDTGVKVGNFKMDNIGSDFVENETERMRTAGISESDINLYKKTVNLHNKKVENFKNAIDSGEDLEVFEILDSNGKTLDPADESDRKKMPLQITKMFRKKYNQLLGDEVSEEVQSSMNNLEKAAEDFANGKDPDGSKFRKAQEQFFEVIDTDPDTRPSVSDVAEILALAEDLSRGRYAVLPSKSNFAVGDVLSANMRAANVGGTTTEEINKSLQILFVTAKGLTSIKYAKGGSSQSSNKIEGTDYKEYTNKEGKVTSTKEIKKDLMDLSTTSYDELWSFSKTQQAKNRTDEIQKKYDIKDCPPEPFTGKTADDDARAAGYLYSDCSSKAKDKRENAWKKRASGAKGIKNIEDCPELNKTIPTVNKETNKLYSKAERLKMARDKMVETYKEQERAGRTLQIVNNRQMETQTWTNRVYEVLSPTAAKKDGRKEGDSRFNKKETNGITVLGGMDFTENPGYDGPCGKPINKMASRITTVKKK
tara:strand:+ start:891 stop:3239 length:2349 start_codon:yes stop_codon:yes gene_type:complete